MRKILTNWLWPGAVRTAPWWAIRQSIEARTRQKISRFILNHFLDVIYPGAHYAQKPQRFFNPFSKPAESGEPRGGEEGMPVSSHGQWRGKGKQLREGNLLDQ